MPNQNHRIEEPLLTGHGCQRFCTPPVSRSKPVTPPVHDASLAPPRVSISRDQIGVPTLDVSSLRCSEKACVFPARPDALGKCVYHILQRREPNLFESLQPTFLLLDRARFGIPETEPDDWRLKDRRRQMYERALFLLDAA